MSCFHATSKHVFQCFLILCVTPESSRGMFFVLSVDSYLQEWWYSPVTWLHGFQKQPVGFEISVSFCPLSV